MSSLNLVGGESSGNGPKKSRAKSRKESAEILAGKISEAKKELKTLTAEFGKCQSAYESITRKSAVAFWTMGGVLAKIKETFKAKKKFLGTTWGDWCKAHNIAPSSADQAITVSQELTEEQIGKLDGITAAKRACGILKDDTSVKEHTRVVKGSKQTEAESAPTKPKTMLGELGIIQNMVLTLREIPVGEDRVAVTNIIENIKATLSALLVTNEVSKVAA